MQAFTEFWKRHPPLFAGLFLLLGVGIGFSFVWPCTLFAALLLLPLFRSPKELIMATLLMASAAAYAHVRYPSYELEGPIKGDGMLHIDSVKKVRSSFSQGMVFEGKLKAFVSQDETLYNLPCRIYLKKKRPKADQDYFVTGTLIQKGPYSYQLKASQFEGAGSYSHAEKRYEIKQKLKGYIFKHYPKRVATFLSSLATGEIEDSLLSFEFSQLGLSHLLAVSGFHFALLALFVTLFLRLLFSREVTSGILIALLSLYFLFLGNAPSVSRAWAGLLLILVGRCLGYQTRALNAIGTALLFTVLFDPLLCTRLGFILSYSATFALISLTPLVERALYLIFPKRSLSELVSMPLFDKHIALLLAPLRKMVAAQLAISLFSMPIILCFFGKYPLLSLFYNLFIPLAVSLILGLFLLASLLSPIWPHAHKICSATCEAVLDQIVFYPKFFEFFLFAKGISSEIVAVCMMPVIIIVIFHQGRRWSLDKIPFPRHTSRTIFHGDRSSVG